MAWDPITSPVDHIVLAGKRSPGIAEVRGASSPRRWDEREGFGLSGSFSVFKGRALAKFSVMIRLYTVADWQGWADFQALTDKMPTRRTGKGKDSGVLDIVHPLLAELDIKSVVVLERMQGEQTADGEWTIEIKFLEWRQPKIALATPAGAAAEPVDPIEENVIKPLTAQFQSLAGDAPPGPPPLPVP